MTRGRYSVTAIFSLYLSGFSQVTLECDFSNPANMRKPMHYHWDVSNRISPIDGFNMPIYRDKQDAGLNIIRPLGGKASGGSKLLEEDTYKWDGQKYYYDWAPLKKQIGNAISQLGMFQLVLDNPSWAFQRGIDRQGFPEIDTYGNAWPPNDPAAWSAYVKAMLRELIATYGKSQVEQWRFRVGSEIGTGGHWRAGQSAFFNHYQNTENAVREALPNAKVGTHFLWASAKSSYGPQFVEWCKENQVRYDFIGVSYYPFYNQEGRVQLDRVYEADFAPIKDHPDWNPEAALEIHEYALIKSMNANGDGFEKAPDPHQNSFTVMLAKMMYEKEIQDVYRWGTGQSTKAAEHSFLDMKGNDYYTSSRHGAPNLPGNMIDAVFARDRAKKQYSIMAYNYNANPGTNNNEPLNIIAVIPALPGTGISYRMANLQNGGLLWSAWKTGRTSAGEQENHSIVAINGNIPSFSFVRFEIIAEKETSVHVHSDVNPRNTLFFSMNDNGKARIKYISRNAFPDFLGLYSLSGRQVQRQPMRTGISVAYLSGKGSMLHNSGAQ